MPQAEQLHPFTVLALATAVLTITTAAGYWPLSLAVILGCLVLAATHRCLAKLCALSALIIAPTFGSQLMVHALFTPGPSPVLAQLGPFELTGAGLWLATQLALRTAVLVVVGLLCALVIDRHRLIAAIDLSKAPPQLGYLVAATLSLLPQLSAKQHAIGQAQALRLGHVGRGPVGWFQRIRLRSVPLVLGSLQDAADRAPHLAARGFPAAGAHTRLREVPDSTTQRVLRRVALVCAVAGPSLILILDRFSG